MHATLLSAMMVGLPVSRTPFVFLAFLAVLGAPAQILELAFIITAPAHPHATVVAVYPALLSLQRNNSIQSQVFSMNMGAKQNVCFLLIFVCCTLFVIVLLNVPSQLFSMNIEAKLMSGFQ